MAILIANIGTSDLAVQVDDYYFPVGFERNEPNIDYSGLTPDEDAAWKGRKEFVEQDLCRELGLAKYTFREFTHKLRDAYQKHPEEWHQRIRPGRIWGAIAEAKERFKVKTAYIFVTDQPPGLGHDSDSVYLFDILQHWFSRQMGNAIELKAVPIPKNIPAVDQDGLLYEYYKFFKHLDKDEQILISIKGGTSQMQTALRVQAISSEISKQLFVEPRLSIKKVLAGEYSDCPLTSYWQYLRTQKYQTVQLLLEQRWDFGGAIKILANWESVLKFLKKYIADEQLVWNDKLMDRVIKSLEIATYCFNLDIKTAHKVLQESQELQLSPELVSQVSNYDPLLNLYTQCRIYWDLDQVANFLARMTSFYEETLYQVNQRLDGEHYFEGNLDKWNLNTGVMRQDMGEDLWKLFKELEGGYSTKLQHQNLQREPIVQLMNRYIKRGFIEVLVKFRPNPQEAVFWQEMLGLLKSLDYWVVQRNHLIHSVEGISKQRMRELWQNRSERDAEACPPNKIQQVMTQILHSGFRIVGEDYRRQFVGEKVDYYIYSEVKQWVIAKLLNEGLA
jgi:hypothetical protein